VGDKKTVPLVYYRDGKRYVIGEANVTQDARGVQVEAAVFDEMSETTKELGLSFGFMGKAVISDEFSLDDPIQPNGIREWTTRINMGEHGPERKK
jgi:hypothetical protein